MHDQAWWKGESGDAASAVAAFEELLIVRQSILGDDHPFTLATRHDLAWWRWDYGDEERAKTDLADVLSDYRRVMEPAHPQTVAVRDDLDYLDVLTAEGRHGVPHRQVRDTRQRRVLGDLPGLDFLQPADHPADVGTIDL
jgi:hypothetical protein